MLALLLGTAGLSACAGQTASPTVARNTPAIATVAAVPPMPSTAVATLPATRTAPPTAPLRTGTATGNTTPTARGWGRAAGLPTPRSEVAAAVLDGRIYVAGGF